MSSLVLHSNSSELANLLAKEVANGNCIEFHKTNGEAMTAISNSISGKNVYIVQTGTKDANNNITELLMMAYACKKSAAHSIVGVIPYMPNSKTCQMKMRGCIVKKLLTKMVCSSGLTRIISIDLPEEDIEGLKDVSVNNLCTLKILFQYIEENVHDYQNAVIVSRDPHIANKLSSYAKRLGMDIATMLELEKAESNEIYESSSSQSESSVCSLDLVVSAPKAQAKDKIEKELKKVASKTTIIILNVIDIKCYESLRQDVKKLVEYGARNVYILAGHNALDAVYTCELVSFANIHEVVVTNSLGTPYASSKLKVIDISQAIAHAIRSTNKSEVNLDAELPNLMKEMSLEGQQ